MADASSSAEAVGGEDGSEKFFDPATGEQISKNAWKKLQKSGGVTKEKKGKAPLVKKEGGAEKKKPKEKEPEVIYVDMTPSGEKKLLNEPFPTAYQPSYVESAWQQWWEKSGFYAPNVEEALKRGQSEKFVMVIPPPNVTGSLHLGHALTTAIEDTLTRWHRMKGKIALWVPGTDHAGIATQSVVEKRLTKEQNLTRHDLGRVEFTKRVWEWKETYGGTITRQIRCLGASVDWGREAFTMDANLSRAVTEAFVRFHEAGIVYRDKRLINWSCALQSAISDIEVEYIDLEDVTMLAVPNHKNQAKYEFGSITSFAYRVEGSDGEEIVVATTRLETMLGDTAVAVHPDDPRYTHLHGKFLAHPFVDRRIPVITDGTLVDMSFGTGAVKVTPAHDPNDYTCGKRNNLEFIIVLTEDGKIAANGGKFAGMMRYDARVAMEAELKTLGLFRGKEKNKMRLGKCSRSGDIIEPMLTPQWYVNCDSMARRAMEAVRDGSLKILPQMHEGTWFRWLENIRDWCVSRQLWWGHRIPAYFARIVGEGAVDKNAPENGSRWIVARSPEDALAAAVQLLKVDAAQISLEQDEDVLDTWFSSGLFPFSVFGWPNDTPDFRAFYPTSLLETGLDILFFWVARMVMMGLQLTDTLPFTTVYLHAMVRDKDGKKMSKSLGNVIDPLEVRDGCPLSTLTQKILDGNLPEKEVKRAIEAVAKDFPEGIPECGVDALRFGLLAYTVQGRDVNLDIKRVVGYRQFCNKLWNAVRFAITYITDYRPHPSAHLEVVGDPHVSPRDLFILSRLNATIVEVNACLADYSFGAATSALHSFFLYDVCDVYLELVKPVFSAPAALAEASAPAAEIEVANARRRCAETTLFTVLEQYLRLLHPIMPFVTEELWQRLPNIALLSGDVPSIMVSRFPEEVSIWSRPDAERRMELVREAIGAARSLRAEYRLANHVKADYYFRSASTEVCDALQQHADDFNTLAKGNFVRALAADQETPKGCCVKVLSDQLSLLVNLTGLLDIDVEVLRLQKESDRLNGVLTQYRIKVQQDAGKAGEKVPESVKALNAEKLAAAEAELATVTAAMEAFQLMR